MVACVVSFVDFDGVLHSVDVYVDGLYEAGVLRSVRLSQARSKDKA